MKVFIIDKYTVVAAALILTVFSFSVPTVFKSAQSAAQTKELPIYSVERTDNKIAITFDSAWNDNDITQIVEVLEEKKCPSTFFVTGQWAEKYPESLKKLHDAHHEIGLHSYNHTLYSTLTKEEIIADLEKCDSCVKAVIGESATLCRAPSGDYTNASILAAKETNRIMIQWDVDSLDWKNLSEDEMKARITDRVKPGSILLFHNGTEQTASALSGILDMLREQGYEFCTVSELIYKDNYHIDPSGVQISDV